VGRGGLFRGPYELDGEGETIPLVVYRANSRAERVRSQLEGSPRIRSAALVASSWNMDIVDVLAETDPLRRIIRVAGHNVLVREQSRP
jgi:hypothetical protein